MYKLSKIGFGSIAIGGGFGPINDSESISTLLTSFEKGINWVDTAPIYGLGHSETIVGKAIKKYKDSIFLSTKCGLYLKKGQLVRDLSPKTIFREVDESLARLGVSSIDLYQCHWPDSNVPVEETWEAMASLVKQGKVLNIGVCNFDLSLFKKIIPIHPVFSFQGPLSIFDDRSIKEIIPYCLRNNIKFLGYRPLQFGILSDTFDIDKLAPDDFRLQRKECFEREKMSEYMRKVTLLKTISRRKQVTLAQLAIAWAIQQKGISSIIVGMRNTTQVSENTASTSITLSESEKEEIDKIIGHKIQ